ncbi:DUF4158 domain-containing protein [Candidatus Poribacteria bacterium]|nr:DUF4158 domain-containing protein [Candidatus Poribacteria bacterium]
MDENYSKAELIAHANLTAEDIQQINQRRRSYNRLGFGYQLGFVRLTNRFPTQQPFEIAPSLLTYIGVQLPIDASLIETYQKRQPTISQPQEPIRSYLQLSRFGEAQRKQLGQFVFSESCRLEQTGALRRLVEQFLRENRILRPASSTLERIIGEQRTAARRYIFEKITAEKVWVKNWMPCLSLGTLRCPLSSDSKNPPAKPPPQR